MDKYLIRKPRTQNSSPVQDSSVLNVFPLSYFSEKPFDLDPIGIKEESGWNIV